MSGLIHPVQSRRLLLAGGVGLIASGAYARPVAQEQRCRSQGFPTVRGCITDCRAPVSTLRCQVGALFPDEARLRSSGGVIAGAVLGGILAWVTKGRIEDVAVGVLLGGVVGGATQAFGRYRTYQGARAGGDPGLAHRTTVADRIDDNQRVGLMNIPEVLTQQAVSLNAAQNEVQRASEQNDDVPPTVIGSIADVGVVLAEASAAIGNGGQTIDIQDETVAYFGARAGASAPPVETGRDFLRAVTDALRPLQAGYADLSNRLRAS